MHYMSIQLSSSEDISSSEGEENENDSFIWIPITDFENDERPSHNFSYSMNSGLVNDLSVDASPLDYFMLLFNDELWNSIYCKRNEHLWK